MGLEEKADRFFEAVGIDYHGLSVFSFLNGDLFGSTGHPVLACVSYVVCTALVCSTLDNSAGLLEGYVKSKLY